MRGSTARRLFATVLAGLSALAVSATGALAATPDYQHYVALGDSYTSGPLIPFQRLDPLGCFRSTNNYPALLAAKLKPATFTDVSCGGADTTNMTTAQSVPLGSNAPQFDALKTDTDLVTLGIGGNDYSVFGTLVNNCTTLRDSDPTGSPCKDKFTVDGVDTIKANISKTQANIVAVLAGIHQRSPHAKVMVLGYPGILPASGYCPARFPAADGDYAWARSVELALNTAVQSAVTTDGNSSYVDTFTPSAGHDVCAQDGAAWINGKDLNLFAAYAYHPFESAMVAEAAIVDHQLGGSGAITTVRPKSAVAGPAQLRAAVNAN